MWVAVAVVVGAVLVAVAVVVGAVAVAVLVAVLVVRTDMLLHPPRSILGGGAK